MYTLFVGLMVVAFVAFVAATFNAKVKLNLVALGLALWVLGYAIQVTH